MCFWPQAINFNVLCEESLLRYQQTFGLVSMQGWWLDNQ
jgi:hypothetical protein